LQIENIAALGIVQRVYVLDKQDWDGIEGKRSSFESGKPWLIPGLLQKLKLDSVAQAYRRGVQCYLAGPEAVPEAEKSDNDLIVVWRERKNEPKFVLGANRRRNGEIRIVFGDMAENGKWRQMCSRVQAAAGVIKVREFALEPGAARPFDAR
jgi:hypothetical protein